MLNISIIFVLLTKSSWVYDEEVRSTGINSSNTIVTIMVSGPQKILFIGSYLSPIQLWQLIKRHVLKTLQNILVAEVSVKEVFLVTE